MKVLLLLALLGAAAANHLSAHLEHPALFLNRHAVDSLTEMPTSAAVLSDSIVDQPVMVVTRTTRFAPEMMAVLVENGINNMPENLESFHDVMRLGGEEFTLCNAGRSGEVEVCVEKPITKLLVPELYKDMTVTRILNDMSDMPWVRMPFSRSLNSEIEVFNNPVLITRTIPLTHESASFVTDSDFELKSLNSMPLIKSLYTTKYLTDNSFLNSLKPLKTKSLIFSPLSSSLVKSTLLPKVVTSAEPTIIESEIAEPLAYTKTFSKNLIKSLNPIHSKFDIIKKFKPIVKYEEVISDVPTAVFKSYDSAIEKPLFNPFFKSIYSDAIEKPYLKSYDDIIAKNFAKNFVNIHPLYKSLHFVDTPSVLPVTKSSSFYFP